MLTSFYQGYFKPEIFSNTEKLAGRRKLIGRSLDLYDGSPNDPLSAAQKAVFSYVQKTLPSAVMEAPARPATLLGTPLVAATPSKHRPLAIPGHMNGDNDGTPRTSVAGSPPPDDVGTPVPNDDGANNGEEAEQASGTYDISLADRTIPIMALHEAIIASIEHASNGDERKRRDFLGSIMLTGGASKTPNLQSYLELQLRAAMPQYPKEILVAPPPRDLDPSVIAWKGGSVFGKLRMTNDSWISGLEYDRLGSRILNYKCMWHW
jgi:actin-related protein 8